MIDSFLLTSFDKEKKSINFATEQLTTIFSTVVRKALRKRKHYRCRKEIAKAGWFDKECQNLRKDLRSLSNKKHRDPANHQTRATYQQTLHLHLHFTFSRRFYPKRLTLHSSYSFYIFFFLSALAFPGNRTHDLGVANAMLYQLSYRKAVAVPSNIQVTANTEKS